LAERLIERLQSQRNIRILDFATGIGRNAEVLRRAGFTVIALSDDAAASDLPLEDERERFGAVLSTHGLLHGPARSIASRLRSISEHIEPGGWLFATFGSTGDARYGRGEQIDESTFAPNGGDERGVPHAYYDRKRLCALLEPLFELESLEEHRVDDVAGKWAHARRPLAGAAHWFAVARRR
jgi:hypothetical protein